MGYTFGPITLVDTLPQGLTVDLQSILGDATNCPVQGSPQTLTCTFSGPPGPGDARHILYKASIGANTFSGIQAFVNLANIVTVTTPGEAYPANNTSTAPIPVQRLTPVGGNVSFPLTDPTGVSQPITLTFPEVSVASTTYAAPMTTFPALPANLQINGIAYDITTTAQYKPPVTICFSGSFRSNSQILHYEKNGWVVLPNQQLLPAGPGPYTTICADTSYLSPFAVTDLVNRPPSVSTGSNQVLDATSAAGANVTLAGSGSDPDGDVLSFFWSGPCGSASTAVATLTCPIGVSIMTLTVNDGRGGTASDTVASPSWEQWTLKRVSSAISRRSAPRSPTSRTAPSLTTPSTA